MINIMLTQIQFLLKGLWWPCIHPHPDNYFPSSF